MIKFLIFSLTIFFTNILWARQEFKVSAECGKKYGPNYVTKGDFFSADPGGKTYNLSRLTNDIENEMLHSTEALDEEKIKCLNEVFNKAKEDASTYWANRAIKESCLSEDNTLPDTQPESCPDSTWKEYKKSIQDITRNENKYNRVLETCAKSASGKSYCSQSDSELKKLRDNAEELAAVGSSGCCDEKNGSAYRVLKTFYTFEFGTSNNEKTLMKECLKRTTPEKDSLAYNLAAGTVECAKNLAFGIIESIKKFSSLLDLGLWSELGRVLFTSQGRSEIMSKLATIAKEIGSQIAAQFEATTSCFNNYYKAQNICKLTSSIITDFLLGAGAGKLIKSVLIPFLKGGMKASEAAALMLKESKVAKDIATKMKPISDAAKNVKGKTTAMAGRASQSALRAARASVFIKTIIKAPPIKRMLTDKIDDSLRGGNRAFVSTEKPRKLTGGLDADTTPSKPSLASAARSENLPGTTTAPSVAVSEGSTTAVKTAASTGANTIDNFIQSSSGGLGSSAGKVLKTSVTKIEARNIFKRLEDKLKNLNKSKLSKNDLDIDIPNAQRPKRYRTGRKLSETERMDVFKSSLQKIRDTGTVSEKARARALLTQLDDLHKTTPTVASTTTKSTARASSAVENPRVNLRNDMPEPSSPTKSVDSPSANATNPVLDFPQVRLNDVVPNINDLTPPMQPLWRELYEKVDKLQKVKLNSADSSSNMRQAWGTNPRGISSQSKQLHNNIDELLSKGQIDKNHAESLHKIIAVSEQTAIESASRPHFLGGQIVAPNTNPGTFTALGNTVKKLAINAKNTIKDNPKSAATGAAVGTEINGSRGEAFDADTIKASEAEVEKLEVELSDDEKAQKYFEKIKSREEVADELDKIKARISALKSSGSRISSERRKELEDLEDRVERMAQKRSNDLLPIPK